MVICSWAGWQAGAWPTACAEVVADGEAVAADDEAEAAEGEAAEADGVVVAAPGARVEPQPARAITSKPTAAAGQRTEEAIIMITFSRWPTRYSA
jgi:hypothetical protein